MPSSPSPTNPPADPDRAPGFDLCALRNQPLEALHAAACRGESAEDASIEPTRGELVMASLVQDHAPATTGRGGGILDVRPEGFGFLRAADRHGRTDADDVFLSTNQIRRLQLRPGQTIQGVLRLPRENERYLAMLRIEVVDGVPVPDQGWAPALGFQHRPLVQPHRRLSLAHAGPETWLASLEFLAPFAHGQRILVRTPADSRLCQPLLEVGVAALDANPNARLLAVLVDQAPEVCADAERMVRQTSRAALLATRFDEVASRHLDVVELATHRARRLVEAGHDVILVLDSMTHLVRAAQAALPHSGKTLRAGLNTNALHTGLRLFGLARQTEGGPALTVITSLATPETPDSVNGAIADEFRGRANAELALDLSVPRGSDATGSGATETGARLDPHRTHTRREELLWPAAQRNARNAVLSTIEGLTPAAARAALRTHLAAAEAAAEAAAAADRPHADR